MRELFFVLIGGLTKRKRPLKSTPTLKKVQELFNDHSGKHRIRRMIEQHHHDGLSEDEIIQMIKEEYPMMEDLIDEVIE